jgi:hypothetical protein
MSAFENPQNAIDAGGTALRPLNRYPWYDAAKDDLARMEIQPPEETRETGPVLSRLIFAAALVTLTIVMIAVIVMIVRAVRLRKARAATPVATPAAGDAERIEALPFPIARGKLSLLDQARQFYDEGNYANATIYLFSHQLVQLDRHHFIRLAKGKTNRQYLREVGRAELLRQLVGQTVVAFEEVFFGHHDINRQRFEACWSRLPEFDSLLATVTPPA